MVGNAPLVPGSAALRNQNTNFAWDRGGVVLFLPFISDNTTLDARSTEGERCRLTVMFIDLVGSTTLSQRLCQGSSQRVSGSGSV